MKGLLSPKNMLFFYCCIVLISCTKEIDTSDITLLNEENQIIEFLFLAEENEQLDIDIVANIDEETQEISIVLPFGTEVTELKPTIIISEKATIPQNIENAIDFSEPITYSVKAENGNVSDYTVKVRVIVSTPRDILLSFFEQNPDNTLDWNLESQDIATWEGVVMIDDKVVELDFTEKGLTFLPPEICDLFYLKTLVLDTNMIAEIPTQIEDLSNNLRTLHLARNQITVIPEEFFSLRKLVNLSIHTNLLTDIPSGISSLTELRDLNISNNELEEVPEELFNLTALNSLFMNNTKLTDIPEGITNLSKLMALGISTNPIGRIPDHVLGLESLTRLDMYNTNISVIPSDINMLTNLRRLQLSRNNLTEVHENVSDLFRLEFLYLGTNTIEEIPTQLSNLINLKTLDITENIIVSIPNAVCDLVNTGTEILSDTDVSCM